jgi:hypothetical protein
MSKIFKAVSNELTYPLLAACMLTIGAVDSFAGGGRGLKMTILGIGSSLVAATVKAAGMRIITAARGRRSNHPKGPI